MKARPLALALLLGAAPGAAAQDSAPGGAKPPAPCEQGTISAVFIDNHSIFDTSNPDLDPRFAWAYRVANALHVRTRESVILRELLLRPGDCLDQALLEDSRRLLRAQGFLSRVDLFALRQPDGTHHLIVDTQDEWSTRLDLRVSFRDGPAFEGLRLRDENLLGTGRSAELFYRERDANRDYGIGYETPQFLGTRWDFGAAAGRTRAGTFWTQSMAYPFVGETGRWAARQHIRRQDRFFDYVVEDADGESHLLLPVRDQSFDLAVVRRTGPLGRLTLLGAAFSFQHLHYPGGADRIERVRGRDYDDRTPPDAAQVEAVRAQARELAAGRVLFLIGQRNVRWIQRRGLDSMRGHQDVPLGVEVEAAIGSTVPGWGDDDALFGSLRLYAAREAARGLLAGRLRGDLRRPLGEPAAGWEDMQLDAELLGYWRPPLPGEHTLVLRAAGSGGWNTRTPYQLTLGGDLALRGYGEHRFPGGRRAILTLEDRILFGGPFRNVLDLGATAFVDVGRAWPGDAPFGLDSGWQASAGLGLRGGFPPGGRTTYRLDLALPLERGAGLRDARLIVSVGELIGLDPGRQDRLFGFRRPGSAGAVFHFPD